MSKGLDALEKLTNYKCSCMSEKIACKEIIEKELKENEYLKTELLGQSQELNVKNKALEIIKVVAPNVFWVMRTNTYKEYKRKCPDDTLLQKEYELLKEVLL